MKWYTTRDAARLLGISPRQVRTYARSALIQPERGSRNQYLFSFQDLVLLRTAAGLHDARIPSRKIQRALERLREELPRGRSLSELRICAEEDRIVVQDGDASWNPLSGQYHLDFSVAELGEKVAPLARGRQVQEGGGEGGGDAEEWYVTGLELEAYAPAEARRAYERAVAANPRHAEAQVNLGRLLHDSGDAAAAEAHYRAALAVGANATAAYNLGVALEDQGRGEEAIPAYLRAIEWEPDLPDAHYNLARLLEARGDPQGALRHLAVCKRIMDARRRGGPSG